MFNFYIFSHHFSLSLSIFFVLFVSMFISIFSIFLLVCFSIFLKLISVSCQNFLIFFFFFHLTLILILHQLYLNDWLFRLTVATLLHINIPHSLNTENLAHIKFPSWNLYANTWRKNHGSTEYFLCARRFESERSAVCWWLSLNSMNLLKPI